MIELRPYQKMLISGVYEHYHQKTLRVLLQLPTGGGKSLTCSRIIGDAVEKRNSVFVIAHRNELIQQMQHTLSRVGIHSGIIKAGVKPTPSRVQVASIQSLARRLHKYRDFNPGLIVIDECHHLTLTNQYKTVLDAYPNAFVLGLTATPTRLDGKGLGDYFQELVHGPQLHELVEQGFLVPPSYFVGASVTGDRALHTKMGDYNVKEMGEAVSELRLEGDLVAEWRRHADGLQTVVFAVNLAHSEAIVDAYAHAGIPAAHIDGATPDDTRKRILADFAAKRIKVLSNVGIVTEGFDVPEIGCVQLARPTQSVSLYYQMCLDMETEILTKSGWKSADTIQKSDIAACVDIDTGKMRWSNINQIIRREIMPEEKWASIASPHLNMRITDQHNLITKSRSSTCKRWKLQTAKLASERRSSYYVPVSALNDIKDNELTDHELRFLGWFLSDGSLNSKNNQITITQSESQPNSYHESIIDCLKGCGFKFGACKASRSGKWKDYAASIHYTVSYGNPRGKDKHLKGWSCLEKYINKSISDDLFSISSRQLGILLETLNIGDGCKPKNIGWKKKTMDICTGNKLFADRLQALCVTRGYRCNIAIHNHNISPLYMLHISEKTIATIGGSAEYNDNCRQSGKVIKRSRIELIDQIKKEEVWCVNTDYGTLITRRKGKVLIMGNCGRALRPAPGKTEAIILDHAGCYETHGNVLTPYYWSLKGTKPKEARANWDESETEPTEKKERIITHDGKEVLVKISFDLENAWIDELKRLQRVCAEKEYKPGWIAHRMLERFGQSQTREQFRLLAKVCGYHWKWADRKFELQEKAIA